MPYALGPVKDHVRATAEYVGRQYNVGSILGVGLRKRDSDHPRGLALDFMVGKNAAQGEQIASHLVANAESYGITYVIWNQRIWSAGRSGEGWRGMEDRGNDTENHKDHVHASFSSTPGTGAKPVVEQNGTGSGVSCVAVIAVTAGGIAGLTYADNLVRLVMGW